MNTIGSFFLVGLLAIGCNRSREPAPTPSAPVPSSSSSSSPVTDAKSAAAPSSSAFTPVPWSTVDPAASSAPSPATDAPAPPPSDLGPDARPVRVTKNLELVKSLDQLSTAWTGPIDQYGFSTILYNLEAEEKNQARTIKNCAEYTKAIKENYHATNTMDYDAEAHFLEQCSPLWFLQRAWPSRTSHLADFRFNVSAPLSLLPADFDVLVSTDRDEAKQAAMQRGDSLAKFHPGLRVTKKDAITLEWAEPDPQGLEIAVKILAFGDGNHDGLEDVMLFQTSRSRSGSFRTYAPFVLTRKTEKGPLEVAMDLRL